MKFLISFLLIFSSSIFGQRKCENQLLEQIKVKIAKERLIGPGLDIIHHSAGATDKDEISWRLKIGNPDDDDVYPYYLYVETKVNWQNCKSYSITIK